VQRSNLQSDLVRHLPWPADVRRDVHRDLQWPGNLHDNVRRDMPGPGDMFSGHVSLDVVQHADVWCDM
jgi:hypothetical protein